MKKPVVIPLHLMWRYGKIIFTQELNNNTSIKSFTMCIYMFTVSFQNTIKEGKEEETVEHLRTQLATLMNSLATLSAEKSRMEAGFQADKKQLRSEKEEVCIF